MKNKKRIEVLNELITINNDRIEGYETASESTEEHDLKSMFMQFMSTSQKCKQGLVREVVALGGDASEGTLTSGKFFRVWMDVKASLSGKDRKAVLKSCEFGEEKALETYNEVIENEFEHLSAEQQTMVVAQRAFIKADRDHVKALRLVMVGA